MKEIKINPNYKITFGKAIARFWRGYFKFSGRATRGEFGWALLFYVLGSAVVGIASVVVLAVGMSAFGYITEGVFVLSQAIPIVWVAATFFPWLSLCVRRTHDFGCSIFWVLFGLLIPIFNLIVIWDIISHDSDHGKNEYGDSEKYPEIPRTREAASEKRPENAGTPAPAAASAVKFCPHCGNKIQRESAFCPRCGGKQPQL